MYGIGCACSFAKVSFSFLNDLSACDLHELLFVQKFQMFILFDTCCHFEERCFKKPQNSCCMVYLAIDSLVFDICQSWLRSLGPNMQFWLKAQVDFSH